MREIKFRGKLNAKGQEHASLSEWQYFTLEEAFSHHGLWEYLDPHTIGQFTGLHDKNGKEIWEGDIVKWGDDNFGEFASEICPIEFREGSFCHGDIVLKHIDMPDLEVIGNIYENGELING